MRRPGSWNGSTEAAMRALERCVIALGLVASLAGPVGCASDSPPVPQARITPEYPPDAKERGIEGWVLFTYTVTKEGGVEDVVIVDSEPPGVWDRNTIRAVESWRFQPAIKDGEPVETRGIKSRLVFELDK